VRRLSCALLAAVGCVQANPEVDPAALDEAAFHCAVEPLLARRCAYPACHGDRRRPFRVYAPNRLRFGLPADALAAPLSAEEHEANFRMASSFATPTAGYAEPLLVGKPLSERLGGAYHGGAEAFGGGDVFESPDDPELGVLRAWIAGATEEAACAP
jgi:hypothetical protein